MTASGWRTRSEPLTAAAAWASGAASRALARAAAARIGAGSALRAAVGDDMVLVIGPSEELPWVEGVGYLGWDGGALVDTAREPGHPPDLVRRAVEQRLGSGGLVVLSPHGTTVTARPEAVADPQVLLGWASRP